MRYLKDTIRSLFIFDIKFARIKKTKAMTFINVKLKSF